MATSPPFVANGSPGRFVATASTAGQLDRRARSRSSTTRLRRRSWSRPARPSAPRPEPASTRRLQVARRRRRPAAGRGRHRHVLALACGERRRRDVRRRRDPGHGDHGRRRQRELATAARSGHGRALHAPPRARPSCRTRSTFRLQAVAGRPPRSPPAPRAGRSRRPARALPIPLAVTVSDANKNPVAGAVVALHRPERRARAAGSPHGGRIVRGQDECRRHRGGAAAHGERHGRGLRRDRTRRGHARCARPSRSSTSRAREACPAGALVTGRLAPADLARVASVGLRTRRMRASLSALGIAIGVAAIVAVLGLSSSSQAGLLGEIDRLGTNLLTVSNGQTFGGDSAALPLVGARDDLPDRPGHGRAGDRLDRRGRLPQPADPEHQHERALGAGREPRPAVGGGHERGAGVAT